MIGDRHQCLQSIVRTDANEKICQKCAKQVTLTPMPFRLVHGGVIMGTIPRATFAQLIAASIPSLPRQVVEYIQILSMLGTQEWCS